MNVSAVEESRIGALLRTIFARKSKIAEELRVLDDQRDAAEVAQYKLVDEHAAKTREHESKVRALNDAFAKVHSDHTAKVREHDTKERERRIKTLALYKEQRDGDAEREKLSAMLR